VTVGYRPVRLPVYSYLLVREDSDRWKIVYHYFNNGINDTDTFIENMLRGQIGKKMKNR
jgi:hypothetical protein